MAKRGKRDVTREEFESAAESYRQVAAAMAELAALMQKSKVDVFSCEANTILSQADLMHTQALRLKSQFQIEQAVSKRK